MDHILKDYVLNIPELILYRKMRSQYLRIFYYIDNITELISFGGIEMKLKFNYLSVIT